MFVYITMTVGLVLLLAVIAAMIVKSRRKRRLRTQQQVERVQQRTDSLAKDRAACIDLFIKAEAGDEEAFYDLRDGSANYWLRHRVDNELHERWLQLKRNVGIWVSSVEAVKERDRWLAEIAAADSEPSSISARMSYLTWWQYLPGHTKEALGKDFFDPEPMRAELNQSIAVFVTGRSVTMQSADALGRIAFLELHRFFKGLEQDGRDPLFLAGLNRVSRPNRDTWNQLVARYIPLPLQSDFISPMEYQVGHISNLAALAVRQGDLTTAKIVWAYCNNNSAARMELGDVLWADLVKFVEGENARLRTEQAAASDLS